MSVFTYSPTLTLDVQRCYKCGSHWAAENWGPMRKQFPFCAAEEMRKLGRRTEIAERSARSSKAAYRRLKASMRK